MRPEAGAVIAAATRARATIATAESLTGGALCAALVGPPGASEAVRGGVVAYAAAVKSAVLSVPPEVIEDDGIVSEPTAIAMARGVRDLLGASWGVATTGVAGPEPHDGREPGTVCLAVCGPGVELARTVHLAGDRIQVTDGAVGAALELVHEALLAAEHGSAER